MICPHKYISKNPVSTQSYHTSDSIIFNQLAVNGAGAGVGAGLSLQ